MARFKQNKIAKSMHNVNYLILKLILVEKLVTEYINHLHRHLSSL
jgi:hypothetical protein